MKLVRKWERRERYASDKYPHYSAVYRHGDHTFVELKAYEHAGKPESFVGLVDRFGVNDAPAWFGTTIKFNLPSLDAAIGWVQAEMQRQHSMEVS